MLLIRQEGEGDKQNLAKAKDFKLRLQAQVAQKPFEG
jgi:hypothetical protein